MSPNVGNFVHDLVEMAKAMETLPQVEAALRESEQHNRQLTETVQSREEAILRYKAEIEALHTKVRETEASRDDAEMRFLELDEKSTKVVSFLGQIQGLAVQADLLLNPPKPQPMPEPAANPEPVYTASGFEAQGHEQTLAAAPEVPTSEINPTASSEVGSQNAYGSTEHTVAPMTSEPAKPFGPYFGLRYHDHPTYVPFSQWIEGGGSEEDYH